MENINILIIIVSFLIYTFRMASINNCLFRKDSNNIVRFRPITLLSGLIAPFRLVKLSINHLSKKEAIRTFKKSFITFDNFFFNVIFLKSCSILYTIYKKRVNIED